MKRLSIVLAVYNEEKNLPACLRSVQDLAEEMVVVDGGSKDKTIEIAKSFGAKVIEADNPPIFHINKQKALEAASCEWILQLDADEIVSKRLADEIKVVVDMDEGEIEEYQKTLPKRQLFLKHQKLIEERDGQIGTVVGSYNAFFVPRLNYFLGKYLRFGGVYPDGVIRLVRKGKAHFPCKSVHEQIEVEGRVGWLQHDLFHMADPILTRYLERNNRYISLMVDEMKKSKLKKNFKELINYCVVKPIWWFLLTQIRHKGILDGWQGIIFSFFSALRFPKAYWKYIFSK